MGLTQQKVADVLKVGRPTISGYETKSIYPDYDKLIVLADLFECSIDYLLGRSNKPKYYSNEELTLTDKILKLSEDEKYISTDTKLTDNDVNLILEELKTGFLAARLLRRVNKSAK